MRFPGIIPAATTPFTADDQVDVEALKANLKALFDGGCTGVVATGTMGEAGQLSDPERALVVETCVAAARERPDAAGFVVVGISAGSTAAAVANARGAVAAGADAVMCLPPLHYPGTLAELVAFYRAIDAASGELPIMLYNNPGASGVDLAPEVIGAIAAEVPGVVAVKECSGDARRIAALIGLGRLEILVGGDDWALEGFAAGAAGWVSGVANVVPAECVELLRLVETGQLAEARTLYQRLLPLSRLDMTPHLVQYFKGAMDAVGRTGGVSRGPRGPLDAEQQAILDAAVAALRA
uniref:dihydrodipicolinate synthase family protein n=1 Tax=Conexibacter woesei TaxID=191495 RepID=UPI0004168399|nr:dihydrodipicolinate synthase family protein [Conexibacter woesei]